MGGALGSEPAPLEIRNRGALRGGEQTGISVRSLRFGIGLCIYITLGALARARHLAFVSPRIGSGHD